MLPLGVLNLLDHVLSIALVCLLHITFPCVHPGWSPAAFQPSQKKYTNEYVSETYNIYHLQVSTVILTNLPGGLIIAKPIINLLYR